MDPLLKKLNDFRIEAIGIKNDPTAGNPWGEEEDRYLRKLEEWLQIAETEPEVAINLFQRHVMFRYDTFKDFLTSVKFEFACFYGKAGNKIRTSRATSKVSFCMKCKCKTKIEGDKCICTNPKCGHSWQITVSSNKSAVDPMKHTKNKIETLIGIKRPPTKIVELLPQICIWLTDLNYLYDWLRYKDQFLAQKDALTYDEWMFEMRSIYQPKDGHKTWSMIIPPESKYAWTFLEYKLIISELSGLLNACVRRSITDFTKSNMKELKYDQVILIFEKYIKANNINKPDEESDELNLDDLELEMELKPKPLTIIKPLNSKKWHPLFPALGEVFEIDGKFWDVGNYINMIALEFVDTPIKTKLSEMFGDKIRIPGLMYPFDWTDPRKHVPEKHMLTEAYSFCIHECFKRPYTIIPPQDVQKIIKIIELFDGYVRDVLKKQNSNPMKKTNSMLYSCKLFFILSLPYFFKYHEVCNYIPVKSRETIGDIKAWWDKFSTAPQFQEQLAPYKVKTEEVKATSENILQPPSQRKETTPPSSDNNNNNNHVSNEINPNEFQIHRTKRDEQTDQTPQPSTGIDYDDLFGDLI